jgi:hypothetical protein
MNKKGSVILRVLSRESFSLTREYGVEVETFINVAREDRAI